MQRDETLCYSNFRDPCPGQKVGEIPAENGLLCGNFKDPCPERPAKGGVHPDENELMCGNFKDPCHVRQLRAQTPEAIPGSSHSTGSSSNSLGRRRCARGHPCGSAWRAIIVEFLSSGRYAQVVDK